MQIGPSLATESVLSATGNVGSDSTVGLVQAVLDAEAEREQAQREGAKPVIFADDLLPGVGASEISLRDGLRQRVGHLRRSVADQWGAG